MWQTVELRELRLFVVLAEELHFGRTAERLQLTPSRVSQSLNALEHKLGAQLVHRTSRRVRLTDDGDTLLRDLRPALERLEGLLEQAGAGARAVEGAVRLGMFSAPAGGERLVALMRAYEALHERSTVEVIQMSWDDPFESLRAGDIDVVATWLPIEQADLVVGPELTSQPRALAVAHDHPLAGRDSVDVEELAEYPLLRFDQWPKELHDVIVPPATPGGRPIPRVRVPPGERAVSDIAVRIARGEVALCTVASATSYLGDLAFVAIPGLPELRSALVWRRPARDPRLRAFIRVARDVLGTARGSAASAGTTARGRSSRSA